MVRKMKSRFSYTYLQLVITLAAVFGDFCFAQVNIAIFDYDDRSAESIPQSKIIEKEIRRIDSTYQVFHYCAKGNLKDAVKIVDQIELGDFELAIVITSDALRVALFRFRKTHYLFTDVNNPLLLGYSSMDRPGHNSSGVTYYVPIEQQLNFYRKIVPGIKKLGFLFDEKAMSRRLEFSESREYCVANQIAMDAEFIKSTEDILPATQKLLESGVDAIILSSSGLVYDHTSLIASKSNQKKIPIFSFNKKAVQLGAVASLSSDYTLMNTQLLPLMITKVLKEGVPPEELPIQYLQDPVITINASVARELGIVIPAEILKKAGSVF